MFGMGFTEIMLIAVIAILFLGPDKLPSTMVEIAKFFRQVKNTIGTVKNSIEEEMHVSDIKKEALAYKKELMGVGEYGENLKDMGNGILADIDETINTEPVKKKEPQEAQEITFAKKKKKKTTDDTNNKKEEDIDV